MQSVVATETTHLPLLRKKMRDHIKGPFGYSTKPKLTPRLKIRHMPLKVAQFVLYDLLSTCCQKYPSHPFANNPIAEAHFASPFVLLKKIRVMKCQRMDYCTVTFLSLVRRAE